MDDFLNEEEDQMMRDAFPEMLWNCMKIRCSVEPIC